MLSYGSYRFVLAHLRSTREAPRALVTITAHLTWQNSLVTMVGKIEGTAC